MIDTSARLRSLAFEVASELKEAAFNHGYRKDGGISDGWHFFRSQDGVPGEIAVARSPEHWFLSVAHPGAASELKAPLASPTAVGTCRCFAFTDQSDLRMAVGRVFELASTLPTYPLLQFEEETKDLGDTEAERLLKQRKGQSIFRDALLKYWRGCCSVTGITNPELLRASHIIPWAKCETSAERLDVHNGLLLAAHWDAAFDVGLVSFEDNGTPLYSSLLSSRSRELLESSVIGEIALTADHCVRLAWHRDSHFKPQ